MKTLTKPKKANVHHDKIIDSGFYRNSKDTTLPKTLTEIWRKNAYDVVTLRGYQVAVGSHTWYYGPAFYDKIGDNNSCLNMAKRRFKNPDRNPLE